MWTRDRLGQYWLGQITGPWRYDKSPESVRLDLYNVRPCRWLEKPFRDYDVPGAVVTSFTGATQALRRIGDHPTAIRVSEMLWAAESDPTAVIPPVAPEQAIVDLFEPEDVEDLVLLWLQQQGWLLIPSSRKHDTPMSDRVHERTLGAASSAGRSLAYAVGRRPLRNLSLIVRGISQSAGDELVGRSGRANHSRKNTSPLDARPCCVTLERLPISVQSLKRPDRALPRRLPARRPRRGGRLADLTPTLPPTPKVAIGHRQAGVAECVADHVDRGPLPRQLGGVGVPEAVGVHPPVHAGLCRQARQQPPHVGAVNPPAVQGAEDRRPRTG